MAKPLELKLSDEARQELVKTRDTHTKAYLRERCAAILKIADGDSGLRVAKHGLYKRRKADTIYDWVQRYREQGLAGLYMVSGRGRKAAFSPTLRNRTGS